MRHMRNAVLTLVAVTLAACGGGSGSSGGITSPGDGRTVNATPSLAFTPGTLTVNAGDVVTFAFGTIAHNVFFDARAGVPADIPGNNASVSTQRTFATPGTYHYTCHIHPGMAGTIVVQ